MKGRSLVDGREVAWSFDGETWRSAHLEVEVGPAGVRRFSGDLDGWAVRGGAVGDRVLWVRDGEEHEAPAAGFTGDDPVWDVAVVRRVALGVGERVQLSLVHLDDVGAALTVRQGWSRAADPEPDVQRYEVADLDTAERWEVHVSDDVPVSGRRHHLLTLTR